MILAVTSAARAFPPPRARRAVVKVNASATGSRSSRFGHPLARPAYLVVTVRSTESRLTMIGFEWRRDITTGWSIELWRGGALSCFARRPDSTNRDWRKIGRAHV